MSEGRSEEGKIKIQFPNYHSAFVMAAGSSCGLETYFEHYCLALPGTFPSVSEAVGQSYEVYVHYIHISAAQFPSSTYRKYPNSTAHLPIHYV